MEYWRNGELGRLEAGKQGGYGLEKVGSKPDFIAF
jgi:hypothetical protein